MVMTDPIADFLTRIRNASMSMHANVEIPSSKVKVALAEILKSEGYIANFEVKEDDGHKTLKVVLKYSPDKERVITGLKRISKPGLKVYCQKDNIPKVLGGLGVAVISTSQGVMTDREARAKGLGGEVLCYVW